MATKKKSTKKKKNLHKHKGPPKRFVAHQDDSQEDLVLSKDSNGIEIEDKSAMSPILGEAKEQENHLIPTVSNDEKFSFFLILKSQHAELQMRVANLKQMVNRYESNFSEGPEAENSLLPELQLRFVSSSNEFTDDAGQDIVEDSEPCGSSKSDT